MSRELPVPYWKMSGAGNELLLVAGPPPGRSGPALARRLCGPRGPGGDGLLALRKEPGGLRVRYWNRDGSAAFCGNGARCAALWAWRRRLFRGRTLRLLTARGSLVARRTGPGRAEVEMPAPKILRLGLRLAGLPRPVHLVDAGGPHAVVFVPNAGKAPVPRWGPLLRRHPAFGRDGANADFVEARGNALRLRTYERGVEAETSACGTGALAAAAAARALGLAPADPVAVRARSGALLRVSLDGRARLEGPGAVLSSGRLRLSSEG